MFYDKVADTLQNKLSIANIKNTGKYKLILYKNNDMRKMKGTIGHVKFSRVLFDEKSGIALVVVTIADNIKNGVVKLYFLNYNERGDWRVIDSPVIDVW